MHPTRDSRDRTPARTGTRTRHDGPAAAVRVDHAERRGPATVDDLSLSTGASSAEVDAFDHALQGLHASIEAANRHVAATGAPRVQLRARDGAAGPQGDVHTIAAAGVRGSGSAMPHQARIQAAFGRHDLGGVRAFTGGAARAAGDALGAMAYARGDAIAFAREPDLFTAAHEAAHVVQQRAGVSLGGGVGQRGDRYEQHADRVAQAVVRGESAEGLLSQVGPAMGRGASGGVAIQRRENPGAPRRTARFAMQVPVRAPSAPAVSRDAQQAEAAASAFSGAAGSVPGRAEQEASFGHDFSAVEAHTGPAAARACEALGADAVAVGNQVAFREANPSKSTVAHELTHVLESGAGGARSVRAPHTTRLDTGHEGTADAVEAAVRGGGRAADVIGRRGLGPAGDGAQLLQSSFSLSGLVPASVGMNSSGQFTAENNEYHLWPRTSIESPPIYILPPPIYFQIATQGTLQTLGRMPSTDPRAPAEFGARLRMDLNFQIAGGVPRLFETYGGVGGRVLISSSVRASRDTWRIGGGDLSLRGALIIGASAGPLRLEWRALEAEIVRGNLVEITPTGVNGLTLEWGEDVQRLAAFFEEVSSIARRIGDRVTAPIRRVVVAAGQSVADVLRGVAELQHVLGCLGGSLGLAIGEGIASQTYGALWDEALAVSMLQAGGARASGRDAAQNASIDSILGTLYSELVTGHTFRRAPPNADQALDLIQWHRRIQSVLVGSNSDVATALRELGLAHLGSMRLIEFMWALQRAGLVRFGSDPNEVANLRHGPLISQLQDSMAAASADHAATCGG